jgi:uncharacterized protein (TIGR02145 family)
MKTKICIFCLSIMFLVSTNRCKKSDPAEKQGQITFSGEEGSKSNNTYTVTIEGKTIEFQQGYPAPECGTISNKSALFTLPVGSHTYTATLEEVNFFDNHIDTYPIGPLSVIVTEGACVSVRLSESMLKLPIITTSSISSITQNSAISGGDITSDNGMPITARGVCWSTTANPSISDTKTVDGVSSGQFVSNLSGLNSNTTYHLRAYATNSVGTSYGADVSFSTLGQPPSCSTNPYVIIFTFGATFYGRVNAYNLSTNVTFEYGTTTNYGSIAVATQSPLTENSNTDVSAEISGLTSSTTYHFRAKAVNSNGTSYGNDQSFMTTSSGTVTDVEGNVYNTVTIVAQTWMAENLKTTKYNDNTDIPTSMYCWYNNDATTYKATYGALYNWHSVDPLSNGGKNVCPIGWHVPNDVEWTTLQTFLGGEYVAGSKLKEIGTTHWISPNDGATNATGFTALPGGERRTLFSEIGYICYLLSSTEMGVLTNWSWAIKNNTFLSRGPADKNDALSIRCLKD